MSARPLMVRRPSLAGRATGVAAGLLVDRLLGEPPTAVHPVAWFGTAMTALERRWWADDRGAGARYAAAGVALSAASVAALARGARLAVPGGGTAVPAVGTAAAVGACVAGRALGEAAGAVRAALDTGDLDGARTSLRALVGRDVDRLDAAGMARAVVESVAENTVDAVVAPVWWALVGGAVGAAAYRAVNTLDAMVGHRSDRYRRFGWASARLDDAANWVPARLTAAAVAACRPAAAGDVWRAVRRDAPAHPSPNAGVAEAAFAGALGLGLGGPTVYRGVVDRRPTLGSGRVPTPEDIGRATALSRDVTTLVAGLLLAPAVAGRVAARPAAGRTPR